MRLPLAAIAEKLFYTRHSESWLVYQGFALLWIARVSDIIGKQFNQDIRAVSEMEFQWRLVLPVFRVDIGTGVHQPVHHGFVRTVIRFVMQPGADDVQHRISILCTMLK